MKIAVIGLIGMGGKAITEALFERGHGVTGLSRHPESLSSREGLKSVAVDLFDASALRKSLRGQDEVISAFAAGHSHTPEPDIFYRQVEGTRRILKALKEAEAGYLLDIGGVASLYVRPGVKMLDDDRFPHWYFGTAPAACLRWLGGITDQQVFTESAVRHEQGELGPDELDPAVSEFVKSVPVPPLIEGCRLALDLFEGRSDFSWSSSLRPGFTAREREAVTTIWASTTWQRLAHWDQRSRSCSYRCRRGRGESVRTQTLDGFRSTERRLRARCKPSMNRTNSIGSFRRGSRMPTVHTRAWVEKACADCLAKASNAGLDAFARQLGRTPVTQRTIDHYVVSPWIST